MTTMRHDPSHYFNGPCGMPGCALTLGQHRLANVGAPSEPDDAATKRYVDAAIAALREELTKKKDKKP